MSWVKLFIAYLLLFIAMVTLPWTVTIFVGIGLFLWLYISEELYKVQPWWMEFLGVDDDETDDKD